MGPLHATIEEFAADGFTHIECHCPRCRVTRLRPMSWLPRAVATKALTAVVLEAATSIAVAAGGNRYAYKDHGYKGHGDKHYAMKDRDHHDHGNFNNRHRVFRNGAWFWVYGSRRRAEMLPRLAKIGTALKASGSS